MSRNALQIKSSPRTQLKYPKSSEANVKSSKSSQRSRHARTSRAALLQFQTVSDLFETSLYTGGFKPVSDLFGMSINFHIDVGPADIAAFLLFQTVSDLFQTSLDCPLLSV